MIDITPNIPKLYTALAEILAIIVYIVILEKRKSGFKLYLSLFIALAIQSGLYILSGIVPVLLWPVVILSTYGFMVYWLYTLTKIKPMAAICLGAQAFIIAEFISSLDWQIYYYITERYILQNDFLFEVLLLILTYSIFFLIIYFIESRYTSKILILFKTKEIFSVVGIALFAFIVGNFSFVTSDSPISARNPEEIFYIRSLAFFCGLILIYAFHEQRLWLNARYEVNAMENLLDKQYQQYFQFKENVGMINRKYHDLKHLISVMRAEKNTDLIFNYLSQMEDEIKPFEFNIKTDNNVLDIVINSKTLSCLNHQIQLFNQIDGHLLDFMDTMDICVIFGNALDNAIESVKLVDDVSNRIIKISVYKQNEFVIIKFENYFINHLVYENERLVTTKKDKLNHGFGIKSIDLTVSKYMGNISIATDDHWFKLIILIPLDK